MLLFHSKQNFRARALAVLSIFVQAQDTLHFSLRLKLTVKNWWFCRSKH